MYFIQRWISNIEISKNFSNFIFEFKKFHQDLLKLLFLDKSLKKRKKISKEFRNFWNTILKIWFQLSLISLWWNNILFQQILFQFYNRNILYIYYFNISTMKYLLIKIFIKFSYDIESQFAIFLENDLVREHYNTH